MDILEESPKLDLHDQGWRRFNQGSIQKLIYDRNDSGTVLSYINKDASLIQQN